MRRLRRHKKSVKMFVDYCIMCDMTKDNQHSDKVFYVVRRDSKWAVVKHVRSRGVDDVICASDSRPNVERVCELLNSYGLNPIGFLDK